MRSLQRHRHVLTPHGVNMNEAAQSLGPSVRSREWSLWLNRIRFFSLSVALPVAVILGLRWYWGLRVVSSGLVESTTIVLRAPASVRVAQIHCHEGQTVKAGDSLFRLEARRNQEQREVAQCLVDQRRVRVDLAQQGAMLLTTDIGVRGDRLEEARDEKSQAEGDHRVALAELDRLCKARAARVVAIEQEQAQRDGDLQVLSQRVEEAAARKEGAQAGEQLAQLNKESSVDLNRDGIVSRIGLKGYESGYTSARQETVASSANVEALRSEVEKSARVDEIARRLEPMTLSELDAQIEAQRQRVDALRERVELWTRIIERRRALSPEENAAELRDLQLKLARAELREAEAQLAALDALIGNVVLRAESDGVIDQLFVAAGQLVDEKTPLASFYDPFKLWGIAYLQPEYAARVVSGQTCRILLEDLNIDLAGRVTWVARSWVPCPRLIRHADDYELRLPVRIECDEPLERSRLWPGARFNVLFSSMPPDAPAAP